MALRPYPGFVGPSYTEQSKIAAYDRTVNWYPSRIQSGTGNTDARYWLAPAPGYTTLATMPTSPGRAIFELNGTVYGLAGTALYDHIDTAPVVRAQGLSDVDGSVGQIIGNGDAGHQLLIRADTTLYALDLINPISSDEPLDPPSTPPTSGQNYDSVTGLATGFFGYASTFVIAGNGETTAGPRIALFNPGVGFTFGGGELVEGISKGVSAVTSVNVYRTSVQVSEALALTAQLKLVGTITNAEVQWANPVLQFTDTFADASLGANVPTTNTATVHVEALSVMDFTSNMIAYLDSFGISLNSELSEIRVSGSFDFTKWDALDSARRADAADRWQAMLVVHKEIWLFGSETTSVWSNAGADGVAGPFAPISSVFVTRGILAPLSACVVDGQPFWVGQGVDGAGGVVYRANGYTPEPVSTHAVEYALSQFTSAQLAAIEGGTYLEQGHVFYELTVPTIGNDLGATWDFDATDGLWSERGRRNNLRFYETGIRGFAAVANTQLTLSRTTGAVYHQSVSYATDIDGLGMVRLRRSPHINEAQRRIRYSHFRLVMETGLGLGDVVSTDPGYDPSITLAWSDDGGQTWSSGYTISAGRIGAFGSLVEWRQLGQAQDRIFEVTCSAAVPWRLIAAFLDYSVGAS